MSLVAYDSSGEESEGEQTNEEGDSNGPSAGPKHVKNDESRIEKTNHSSLVANSDLRKLDDRHETANIKEGILVEESDKDALKKLEEGRPRGSIFSFLPPPKKESGKLIIEDADEMVIKKTTVDVPRREAGDSQVKITGKLNLPKPKRVPGDEKQRVKITVPSLQDDDSDDDEDGGKMSRKKTVGKGGSGLLGCLPQPKFNASSSKASGSGNNDRKPSRLYVPYTLSKKKEEVPKTSREQQDIESDSEDEGSSASFFSFGDANEKKQEKTPSKEIYDTSKNVNHKFVNARPETFPMQKEPERIVKNPPKQIQSSPEVSKKESAFTKDVKISTVEVSETTSRNKLPDENVAESYGTFVTGPYGTNFSQNYHQSSDIASDSVTGPYFTYSDSYDSTYSGMHSRAYDMASGDRYGSYSTVTDYNQGYTPNEYGSKAYLNPDPNIQYNNYENAGSYSQQQESIDADQLRRLQGKRERRIQEVDIIDIHGEQMQCDPSMLLKNITEEKTHIPKKSKTDLPSGQQKRKHQITYLAFQAKERENELRKSWAANLQTKRQTQQKYGF